MIGHVLDTCICCKHMCGPTITVNHFCECYSYLLKFIFANTVVPVIHHFLSYTQCIGIVCKDGQLVPKR